MSASAILSALNAPAATGLAVSDDRTAADGAFADLLATETTDAAVAAIPVAPTVARTPSLSIVIDGPIDGDAEAGTVETRAEPGVIGTDTGLTTATPILSILPSTGPQPSPAGAASDGASAADAAPAAALKVPSLRATSPALSPDAPIESPAGLVIADETAVPTGTAGGSDTPAPIGPVTDGQTTGTIAPAPSQPARPAVTDTAPKAALAARSETSTPPAFKGSPAAADPTVEDATPAIVATPREPRRAAPSGIDLVKAALASAGRPSAPARVTGVRAPIVTDVALAPTEVAEAPADTDPSVDTHPARPSVAAAASAIPAPTPPVASKTTPPPATSPINTAPPPSEDASVGTAATVTDPGLEAVPASPGASTTEVRGSVVNGPAPTPAPSVFAVSGKTGQLTNASVDPSDQSQGGATIAPGNGASPDPQPAPTVNPVPTGFEASPLVATAATSTPAASEAPAAQGATVSTPDTAAPTPPPAETSLSSLSRATIEATAQLAAQITRRLDGRSTRLEMALTPDGLGRVDVSLDIDADGQLAARLAFDNPLAATDLRGRADELRRQLEDAGFTLARDALEFSGRDGSSGGGQAFDRRQGRAAAYANRNAAADAEALSAPAPWINPNQTPRGVDLKV